MYKELKTRLEKVEETVKNVEENVNNLEFVEKEVDVQDLKLNIYEKVSNGLDLENTNKSQLIRSLLKDGYKRNEISRILRVRYQYVNNVKSRMNS